MAWHPSDRLFLRLADDQSATGEPLAQELPHACSYCGSTDFEAPVDTGRGATATCSQCGGSMSSWGGQWTPELIGDPSNHPSPKVDPRSGAGFGQNYLVHPEGFDMMPPKEAFSVFEVIGAAAIENPKYRYRQTVQTSTGYEDQDREIEGPLYHGGRANLRPGDHLTVGRKPNSWGDEGPKSTHNYFTSDMDVAGSYARDLGHKGRIYEVEPTGDFKKDYGPSDYKTPHPLHILREVPRHEWPEWAAKQAAKAHGPVDWDTVGAHYPSLYGDPEVHGEAAEGADGWAIGDAANHLAHDRAEDPGAENSSVHELEFHPTRNVDTQHIDYVRHPPSDHRVAQAIQGYKDHPDKMPPLVLVHRHGIYHVADGHHRAAAAAYARVKPNALVAHSPHPDEPFSDGVSGPSHGAEPIGKVHHTAMPRRQFGEASGVAGAHVFRGVHGTDPHAAAEATRRGIAGGGDLGPGVYVAEKPWLAIQHAQSHAGDDSGVVMHGQIHPDATVAHVDWAPHPVSGGQQLNDWARGEGHDVLTRGPAGHRIHVVLNPSVIKWDSKNYSPDEAREKFDTTHWQQNDDGSYTEPGDKTPEDLYKNSALRQKNALSTNVLGLQGTQAQGLMQTTAEVDWCAHRHLGSCFWPGDNPPPGTVPQRRGACNWTTAWSQQLCPMSDPGPMAGMFVKGAKETNLLPVHEAGFAGFVEPYEGHFRESDTMDRRTRERHQARYDDAPEDHHYPAEQPTPTGSHGHLIDFMHDHRNDRELWNKQGEVQDVDLSHGVYATQPYLVREHLQRYHDDPQSMGATQRANNGTKADWLTGYPGTHMPMFVRHQGDTFAVEGHHRVGAALGRGEDKIRGIVYNADKHGWNSSYGDDSEYRKFHRYSAADGVHCVHEHDDDDAAWAHELYNHDDGICAATGPEIDSHKLGAQDIDWQEEKYTPPGGRDERLRHHLMPVRQAGFAGYVEGHSGDHEASKKHLQQKYGPFDRGLFDSVAPEKDEHEQAHVRETGQTSPAYDSLHDKAYFNAIGDKDSTDTSIGHHPKLHQFLEKHGESTHMWKSQGDEGPVDLTKGVYATQPYVLKAHVNRYADNPQDVSAFQHVTPEENDTYVGSHMPLFVRHEGNLYAAEGHHRVAAALQRGDSSIHGITYDMDKHGSPLVDPTRQVEVEYNKLHRKAARAIDCDFAGSPEGDAAHRVANHDDGICVLTEATRSLPHTASLRDPEVRLQFTATWADVRNKAKRIRSEGGVRILMASSEGVVGEVRGEHNIYETSLTYVPGSAKVGYWHCGCAWAAYAWGRSPKYRRFEGRMCSHALAMQFEAQSRSAHGREVMPDMNRPDWMKQRTPVVIQHQRDPQLDLTRRAVPPGNMRKVFSMWEAPLGMSAMDPEVELTEGAIQYIATGPDPELHHLVQRELDRTHDADQEKHADNATYAENYEPLKNSDVPEEHHGGWAFHRNVDAAPPVANMFADLFGAQKEHQHYPPVSVTQYKHPVNREPLHLDEHGNSYRRHYEWTSPDARVPEFRGWSGPHSASETLREHPTWSQSFDEQGQRQHHMRTHEERLQRTGTDPTDSHHDVVMRRNRALGEAGWGVVSSLWPVDSAVVGLAGSRIDGHRQVTAASVCPECHGPVAPLATSCPHCGASLTPSDTPDVHLGAQQPYYHGTTVPDLNRVMPSNDHGKDILYPHMADPGYAYATTDPREAWNYAKTRYHNSTTGVPHVYEVRPRGEVEPDPHFPGDLSHRSRAGWDVAGELPMPDHMHQDDWPEERQPYPWMEHQGAKKPGLPTVAGIVLKALDTGRILMLQRGMEDEKDPARGTWEFPGGHVEEGDASTVHGAVREWEEEVGQRFPEGAAVVHTWTSPNGIYAGYVALVPEERAVVMHEGRIVPNPDDPKGDLAEQAAWWTVEHARKNPALRTELKSGTPWREIERAGDGIKAAQLSGTQGHGLTLEPGHLGSRNELVMGRVLTAIPDADENTSLDWWPVTADSSSMGPLKEFAPYPAADPPPHSMSQNPASTGFATSEDPDDWAEPRSTREDLRVSVRYHGAVEGYNAWRDRLWSDLREKGQPVPQTNHLYRAVSDGEMQSARQKAAFHSQDGQGLFVTDDPDRIGRKGGGYSGGEPGGHIIEIDRDKVNVGERPSYYNNRLKETTVDHVPMHAVTRSWSWNDEAQDHLPTDAHHTATLHDEPEPALPSTDGEREEPFLHHTLGPNYHPNDFGGHGQMPWGGVQHAHEDEIDWGETAQAPARWPHAEPEEGSRIEEFDSNNPEHHRNGLPIRSLNAREDPLSPGTPAPRTDAETMRHGYDDLTEFTEDHPEISQTGSVAEIVAQFQRTAGAQALANSSPKEKDEMDIATAARMHLEATQGGASQQKTALKSFTFPEQQQLIHEGGDVTARNLDELKISGTHYEVLEAALKEQEGNGIDASDLFVL